MTNIIAYGGTIGCLPVKSSDAESEEQIMDFRIRSEVQNLF
jgi:hypothetical protein